MVAADHFRTLFGLLQPAVRQQAKPMKVCLTGAAGMLGQALQQVFPGPDLIGLTLEQLDVTILDDTVKTLRQAKPDFLIHTAALTDVDLCESEPEKAYL